MPFIKLNRSILDAKELFSPGRFLVRAIKSDNEDGEAHDMAYAFFSSNIDQSLSDDKKTFLQRCQIVSYDGDRPSLEDQGETICLISPYDMRIETQEGLFYVLDKSSIVLSIV